MAVKDKYNNNLRRGNRVAGAGEHKGNKGEVTAGMTGKRGAVLVQWDEGEEEMVDGRSLILEDKAFR